MKTRQWPSLFGRIAAGALLLGQIAACVPGVIDPPPTTVSEQQQYEMLYPYYAELCALSELGKKPGFGAEITSAFGGHAVIYMSRVCRAQDAAYPTLQMCDEQAGGASADGVGISANAHFKNADWIAIEGRELFFNGDLKAGEALTRDRYRQVLAKAQSKRIYDDVSFHEETYRGMPAGFTPAKFQYEISIATDYAIKFGRNRYCARIPLSRPQTAKMIDYLNTVNEPYRKGEAVFDWNVMTHNCSHINHNALAAANLWDEWPMDRFILISMFDFPVPKNEFVNAMRRTNDMDIGDLEALYDDQPARRLLLEDGRLPTAPGAIVDLDTIASPNEVYDTDSKIIFYDDPVTGSYQSHFNAMMTQPRYLRLRDNLVYFSGLYDRIAREKKPLQWYVDKRKHESEGERASFAAFYEKYYDYIGRQTALVARQIAMIDATTH